MPYTFKIERTSVLTKRPNVWYEDTGHATPIETLDEVKELIRVLSDPLTVKRITIERVD